MYCRGASISYSLPGPYIIYHNHRSLICLIHSSTRGDDDGILRETSEVESPRRATTIEAVEQYTKGEDFEVYPELGTVPGGE